MPEITLWISNQAMEELMRVAAHNGVTPHLVAENVLEQAARASRQQYEQLLQFAASRPAKVKRREREGGTS